MESFNRLTASMLDLRPARDHYSPAILADATPAPQGRMRSAALLLAQEGDRQVELRVRMGRKAWPVALQVLDGAP